MGNIQSRGLFLLALQSRLFGNGAKEMALNGWLCSRLSFFLERTRQEESRCGQGGRRHVQADGDQPHASRVQRQRHVLRRDQHRPDLGQGAPPRLCDAPTLRLDPLFERFLVAWELSST